MTELHDAGSADDVSSPRAVTAPRLTFIAHLPLQPSGGGLYVVNWHVHRQLQRHFQVAPFVRVEPPVSRIESLVSKFQRRVLKRPGAFYQFSPRSLDRTARLVEAQTTSGTDALFFRSSTRWIHCRPRVPYFVHLDAVFRTFFRNTFRDGEFLTTDIERICEAERNFLSHASGVFFESRWGLQRAVDALDLPTSNLEAPGIGGALAPPSSDTWDGQTLRLLTIAKHFRQKGGDLVLEAFQRLQPEFPGLVWHIVGGQPDGDWQGPGIHYEGFLSLEDATQRARLQQLLSSSFLLVHPTREDVNPLVLIEAAGCGCPCVSVNDFAIPDLVEHGRTGLLLDRPVTGDNVAAAIRSLIRDRPTYLQMRAAARDRVLQRGTWDSVGDAIARTIRARLQGPRA